MLCFYLVKDMIISISGHFLHKFVCAPLIATQHVLRRCQQSRQILRPLDPLACRNCFTIQVCLSSCPVIKALACVCLCVVKWLIMHIFCPCISHSLEKSLSTTPLFYPSIFIHLCPAVRAEAHFAFFCFCLQLLHFYLPVIIDLLLIV